MYCLWGIRKSIYPKSDALDKNLFFRVGRLLGTIDGVGDGTDISADVFICPLAQGYSIGGHTAPRTPSPQDTPQGEMKIDRHILPIQNFFV